MIRSVIFRLFMLVYAAVIVLRSIGFFPLWAYIGIGGIYFLAYLILKIKDLSFARLILDFIFINIIIWNRDIKDPIIFLFILLPTINAINFSGKRSSNLSVLIATTLTFWLNMKQLEHWIWLPVFSLWSIYFLSRLNQREWDLINRITLTIDTYFLEQEKIEHPYRIYEKIINSVNSLIFKGNNVLVKICAYTLKGETLWLVNAYPFIWERKRILPSTQIEQLKHKHIIRLRHDTYDEYMFYIGQQDAMYIFICEVKHKFTFYRFNYIMMTSLSKMVPLLNSEFRIAQLRNKKFNEIKDNILYVNSAVKIMHFIRNRMTPLTNILAYNKKYGELPQDIRAKMDERMKKEILQAELDLTDILSTANYLLDKSNNPFAGSQIKRIQVSKIFVILSEIVELLLDGIVIVDNSVNNTDNSNYIVRSSLVELKILFTDWINNICKYKNKFYEIRMSIIDDILKIRFVNDYNCENDVIQRLVRDINSNEKNAVIEGKNYGYGISIIKSIASDLNIDISAQQEDNRLYFELNIKLYDKEKHSNI